MLHLWGLNDETLKLTRMKVSQIEKAFEKRGYDVAYCSSSSNSGKSRFVLKRNGFVKHIFNSATAAYNELIKN